MITSTESHTRTWELCLRQWSVISPILLPISDVLGELESSSNADRLLRNLLSSVSENTLTRYLANIHKFILVSEELALELGSLKQINIAGYPPVFAQGGGPHLQRFEGSSLGR